MSRKISPSDAARALRALRKTHGGGRQKDLRPCPECGAMLGARERRAHTKKACQIERARRAEAKSEAR